MEATPKLCHLCRQVYESWRPWLTRYIELGDYYAFFASMGSRVPFEYGTAEDILSRQQCPLCKLMCLLLPPDIHFRRPGDFERQEKHKFTVSCRLVVDWKTPQSLLGPDTSRIELYIEDSVTF